MHKDNKKQAVIMSTVKSAF